MAKIWESVFSNFANLFVGNQDKNKYLKDKIDRGLDVRSYTGQDVHVASALN